MTMLQYLKWTLTNKRQIRSGKWKNSQLDNTRLHYNLPEQAKHAEIAISNYS